MDWSGGYREDRLIDREDRLIDREDRLIDREDRLIDRRSGDSRGGHKSKSKCHEGFIYRVNQKKYKL